MEDTSTNGIFRISNGKSNTPKKEEKTVEAANFENAITATGFGKYNLLLLLLAIPSGMAAMFDTTTMSYVFPIAQCDLNLSLGDKGLLNAVTYIGMTSSAFVWGYVADTFGRKKLLVFGYLLDGFFVLLCAFSQHFTMLLVAKFMAGFLINGPFAALMSYMNEFHQAKYRSFIPIANGIIYSMANTLLPILGWLIFSDSIHLSFFNDAIVLRSWNVFLLICALPSLIGGVCYIFLPESPKFLMTVGKNEDALKIFQRVYSCNSGRSRDEYPVKALQDENKFSEDDFKIHSVAEDITKAQVLKEGCMQIVPLFYPPYLGKFILVIIIQFMVMMGLNTLRLWLPQIFTAINDYHISHDGEDASLCTMLEMVNPSNVTRNETCFVNYDNSANYMNNIIVALTSAAIYLATAVVIRKIGKKRVLVTMCFVSALCATGLYFAHSDAVVVALSSLHVGFMGVACNIVVSIVVDIFPTTLRTMTVSLTMMCGRLGAMSGNLLMPMLLTSGCLPLFVFIASLSICSALLSLLLPTTDKKALQ